jgi:ferritin-like metal-binding protein YciE
MELTHFGGMYIAELQELVSAERQLTASLLGMSGAASHPTLKSALVRHRQQTHFQVERGARGDFVETRREPDGTHRSSHAVASE